MLTMVTSHASDLPASQGISLLPSGCLPSSLTNADGCLMDDGWNVGLTQGLPDRSRLNGDKSASSVYPKFQANCNSDGFIV